MLDVNINEIHNERCGFGGMKENVLCGLGLNDPICSLTDELQWWQLPTLLLKGKSTAPFLHWSSRTRCVSPCVAPVPKLVGDLNPPVSCTGAEAVPQPAAVPASSAMRSLHQTGGSFPSWKKLQGGFVFQAYSDKEPYQNFLKNLW